MVKGIARRVILVNSPEPHVFEQAFFLVREDILAQGKPEQALKEAEAIAKHCLHKQSPHPDIMPRFFAFLGGCVVASLLWGGFLFL